MINVIATSDIPLEASENARRVTDPTEQMTFADEEPDALRSAKGMLTGVLLGAFIWALLIGLYFVL